MSSERVRVAANNAESNILTGEMNLALSPSDISSREFNVAKRSQFSSKIDQFSEDDYDYASEKVYNIDISDYSFSPQSIRIPTGSTILFRLNESQGAKEHVILGICANSKAPLFRSPLLSSNGSTEFYHTFNTKLEVDINCEVINDMCGHISVFSAEEMLPMTENVEVNVGNQDGSSCIHASEINVKSNQSLCLKWSGGEHHLHVKSISDPPCPLPEYHFVLDGVRKLKETISVTSQNSTQYLISCNTHSSNIYVTVYGVQLSNVKSDNDRSDGSSFDDTDNEKNVVGTSLLLPYPHQRNNEKKPVKNEASGLLRSEVDIELGLPYSGSNHVSNQSRVPSDPTVLSLNKKNNFDTLKYTSNIPPLFNAMNLAKVPSDSTRNSNRHHRVLVVVGVTGLKPKHVNMQRDQQLCLVLGKREAEADIRRFISIDNKEKSSSAKEPYPSRITLSDSNEQSISLDVGEYVLTDLATKKRCTILVTHQNESHLSAATANEVMNLLLREEEEEKKATQVKKSKKSRKWKVKKQDKTPQNPKAASHDEWDWPSDSASVSSLKSNKKSHRTFSDDGADYQESTEKEKMQCDNSAVEDVVSVPRVENNDEMNTADNISSSGSDVGGGKPDVDVALTAPGEVIGEKGERKEAGIENAKKDGYDVTRSIYVRPKVSVVRLSNLDSIVNYADYCIARLSIRTSTEQCGIASRTVKVGWFPYKHAVLSCSLDTTNFGRKHQVHHITVNKVTEKGEYESKVVEAYASLSYNRQRSCLFKLLEHGLYRVEDKLTGLITEVEAFVLDFVPQSEAKFGKSKFQNKNTSPPDTTGNRAEPASVHERKEEPTWAAEESPLSEEKRKLEMEEEDWKMALALQEEEDKLAVEAADYISRNLSRSENEEWVVNLKQSRRRQVGAPQKAESNRNQHFIKKTTFNSPQGNIQVGVDRPKAKKLKAPTKPQPRRPVLVSQEADLAKKADIDQVHPSQVPPTITVPNKEPVNISPQKEDIATLVECENNDNDIEEARSSTAGKVVEISSEKRLNIDVKSATLCEVDTMANCKEESESMEEMSPIDQSSAEVEKKSQVIIFGDFSELSECEEDGTQGTASTISSLRSFSHSPPSANDEMSLRELSKELLRKLHSTSRCEQKQQQLISTRSVEDRGQVEGEEIENLSFLKERWEEFQRNVTVGYDTLPDGSEVPIRFVCSTHRR